MFVMEEPQIPDFVSTSPSSTQSKAGRRRDDIIYTRYCFFDGQYLGIALQ